MKEERKKLILDFLDLHDSSTIRELAEYLAVSVMTARRDIEWLAGEGLVKNVYGAVLGTHGTMDSFSGRFSLLGTHRFHIDQKSLIAGKAISFLKPNDVIFMNHGSTMEILAKAIPVDFPCTVITNALNILMELRKKNDCKVIFPGGFFHEETLAFESTESVEFIRRNRASIFFTSAHGVSDRMGVTTASHSMVDIMRAGLSSSLTKVLLVDSSKFD